MPRPGQTERFPEPHRPIGTRRRQAPAVGAEGDTGYWTASLKDKQFLAPRPPRNGPPGGIRVADLDCGVGLVTALLAELVGLFHLVQAAGFPAPEITFNQPVRARGEDKRLLELSVAEAGPAFIEAGLITAEELGSTLMEMQRLNADETVLAVMPRMTQVGARKPAPPPGGSP